MGKPISALISPRTISLYGRALHHPAAVNETDLAFLLRPPSSRFGLACLRRGDQVTLMSESNELLSIVFISVAEPTGRARALSERHQFNPPPPCSRLG